MNKFPKKIPWSSIDNIDLDSIVSNAVEEEFSRQRQIEYNKRPYVDLSERKEKLKDHTKVYKGIYKKVEKDLMAGKMGEAEMEVEREEEMKEEFGAEVCLEAEKVEAVSLEEREVKAEKGGSEAVKVAWEAKEETVD